MSGLLYAFSSDKGGVGKTTLATLLAYNLAESGNPPVVLIDADIVGTDLVLLLERRESQSTTVMASSLFEELTTPAGFSVSMPAGGAKRWDLSASVINVMRSYPIGKEADEIDRDALERCGTFVRLRFKRLLEDLRGTPARLVIDLPAFHVGFAKMARSVIKELGGVVYDVVSTDIRDLYAVSDRLRRTSIGEQTGPPVIVVNPWHSNDWDLRETMDMAWGIDKPSIDTLPGRKCLFPYLEQLASVSRTVDRGIIVELAARTTYRAIACQDLVKRRLALLVSGEP